MANTLCLSKAHENESKCNLECRLNMPLAINKLGELHAHDQAPEAKFVHALAAAGPLQGAPADQAKQLNFGAHYH